MPVSPRIPAGHADLRPAWRTFRGLVDAVTTGLAADGPDLVIAALDGGPIGAVPLADARAKLAATTWALGTRAPRNGGQGAVHSAYRTGWKPSAWVSAQARFHVQGFREYAALGEPGLAYLVLHELAHVTRLGLLVQNACWRRYLRDGGRPDGEAYAQSAWYVHNEQVANEIARRLGEAVGVTLLASPTFGSPPTALRLGVRTQATGQGLPRDGRHADDADDRA